MALGCEIREYTVSFEAYGNGDAGMVIDLGI